MLHPTSSTTDCWLAENYIGYELVEKVAAALQRNKMVKQSELHPLTFKKSIPLETDSLSRVLL